MRQPKTGRRASQEERALAQQVVDLYRKAESSPDFFYLMNPDDPPDEWMYFDGKDPSEAIGLLEHFAQHGTFQPVGIENSSLLALNIDFDECREAGVSYEDTILKLAEERHVDTRTIERWLEKPIGPLLIVRSSVKFSRNRG